MKKRIFADITLIYPNSVHIEAGPFSIETNYNIFLQNDYNIGNLIVSEYIDNIRANRSNEDERKFLKEYFNDEHIKCIEAVGNREPDEETKKELVEADEDIESGKSDVYHSVEDFMASL